MLQSSKPMRAPCLAVAFLVTAACVDRQIPELPAIDTSGFQPSVRIVTEEALTAARSRPSDPEATGRLGMVLHAHDQFAAAAACYRRAAALDPKRADYLYYLGAALAADGKYAEAVDPLSRAVSLESRSPAIRLRLADALYQSGKPDDATREYRKVIEQDASIAAAHYGLGRTLRGDAAIEQYKTALALFPQYGAAQFALAAEYRKAGRAQDADKTLAGYEHNRTATPPMDDPLLATVFALNTGSTGLMRRAQGLERDGQLAAAAEVCERVVGQDPKFVQAWLNLVSLYGRLNEPTKLERAYAQAVTLAPDRAEPHYNYGVYCLQANRFDDARKAFEKATELDPRNAEAWNNLAGVVERSGALDSAVRDYRRAVELKPDSRTSHFGLGRIYANQRKYAEAIAEFEKTLQPEDDQTPGYLYALGAVHARAGHRKESIQYLEAARHKASAKGETALLAAIDRDLRTLGAAK